MSNAKLVLDPEASLSQNLPLIQKHWEFLLRTMSDEHLCRLFRKIIDKINRRFGGGTRYGVDLPTLAMCEPGLWYCYMVVRTEGSRRGKERKAA